jgi:hypothetical protein
VRLYDALTGGKPETRSAFRPRTCLVHPVKALADIRQMLGRYTLSRILYGDNHLLVLLMGG